MNFYFELIPDELITLIFSYVSQVKDMNDFIQSFELERLFGRGNTWKIIFNMVFQNIDLTIVTGINYEVKDSTYYTFIFNNLLEEYHESVKSHTFNVDALNLRSKFSGSSDLVFNSDFIPFDVVHKMFYSILNEHIKRYNVSHRRYTTIRLLRKETGYILKIIVYQNIHEVDISYQQYLTLMMYIGYNDIPYN